MKTVVFLILTLFLANTFAQSDPCGGSAITDCMQCFIQAQMNGVNCSFCEPRQGNPEFGCFQADTPGIFNNNTICSGPQDSTLGNPSSCPDDCRTSENTICTRCLQDSGCGWCMQADESGVFGCVESNPNDPSLPWISGLPNCGSFRSTFGMFENQTLQESCSPYVPCDQNNECFDCTQGFQAFDERCVWCQDGIDQRNNSIGTCFPFNSTCDQIQTQIEMDSQCPLPFQSSSANSEKITGFMAFFGIILTLFFYF